MTLNIYLESFCLRRVAKLQYSKGGQVIHSRDTWVFIPQLEVIFITKTTRVMCWFGGTRAAFYVLTCVFFFVSFLLWGQMKSYPVCCRLTSCQGGNPLVSLISKLPVLHSIQPSCQTNFISQMSLAINSLLIFDLMPPRHQHKHGTSSRVSVDCTESSLWKIPLLLWFSLIFLLSPPVNAVFLFPFMGCICREVCGLSLTLVAAGGCPGSGHIFCPTLWKNVCLGRSHWPHELI